MQIFLLVGESHTFSFNYSKRHHSSPTRHFIGKLWPLNTKKAYEVNCRYTSAVSWMGNLLQHTRAKTHKNSVFEYIVSLVLKRDIKLLRINLLLSKVHSFAFLLTQCEHFGNASRRRDDYVASNEEVFDFFQIFRIFIVSNLWFQSSSIKVLNEWGLKIVIGRNDLIRGRLCAN